jgi:hypothetical protein
MRAGDCESPATERETRIHLSLEETAMTKRSSDLNPATAHVAYRYEPFGDYPHGEYSTGRVYYWFDPETDAPAVEDFEFRNRHPEISDTEWERLFYEAFDREETALRNDAVARDPTLLDSEEGRLVWRIGRMFGPRPPRS